MKLPVKLIERYFDLLNLRRTRINKRMELELKRVMGKDYLPCELRPDLSFLTKTNMELRRLQAEWDFVNQMDDKFWDEVKVCPEPQ